MASRGLTDARVTLETRNDMATERMISRVDRPVDRPHVTSDARQELIVRNVPLGVVAMSPQLTMQQRFYGVVADADQHERDRAVPGYPANPTIQIRGRPDLHACGVRSEQRVGDWCR